MIARLGGSLWFIVVAATASFAQEPKLIGHWPLQGDLKDFGPHQLHAINSPSAVNLRATGRGGKPNTAAQFDGRGTHLTIPHHHALKLGTSDFTLVLWLHTEQELDDDLGDLVSLYDPVKRRGFTLSLRNNAGVTHSQANHRQLQFGIDNGSEPTWVDEGRPGQAIYGMSLAVHDGHLYSGTCEAGKDERGRVYRYDGPGTWKDLGAPDQANAISTLASFGGKLYAGSAKYRLGGSALVESKNANLGGKVFRLEGRQWLEVGHFPKTEAMGGMVVFRGQLYASSLYPPAGFFRREKDGQWTTLPTPNGKRVEALTVFNGYLWATGYDEGHVYRFDGQRWADFGQIGEKENTQTYAFAVYTGQLCVATWRTGKVYRLDEEKKTWIDMGRLGDELEVMGMLVHNGQLYAGTLPGGAVYRYEGGTIWRRVGQLDKTPNAKYRRVWTMAQFQGKLFCTTLPSGHIHSMTTGVCVTHDRELAPGWRQVAAVRSGDRLRLYVDGNQVAESAAVDGKTFDLTSQQALRIGAGPGDYFFGKLSDIRLYRGALSGAAISKMAKEDNP